METLKQLENRMNNIPSEEWNNEQLSTHYKILSMMLDNGDYHPDYRGYVDQHYYKYYLKVKKCKQHNKF